MNDGSRATPMVTAGLDLGDKYSYLCLIDTDTGKVVEEGRLRTGLTPDERTISAYATAASSTIACSYSAGLR
jgi:hypothetical protein